MVAAALADGARGFRATRVLGVRVDALNLSEAVELIGRWAAEGRPRQVVTVNPEFVMLAQQRADFAAVLEQADLAAPDGVGVLWAARRQGCYLPERVGGTDLVLPLAQACAARGFSIFLLGAAPRVADKAAARLARMVPNLKIAGTFAASPRSEDEQTIVERVTAVRPNILLVAYGAPAQDLWIARNRQRLGVPVSIGVGGTLDYLAGVRPRAPLWIRRLWLDWAFRLVTQPWRWRRMLVLPRFAAAVLAEPRA